MRWIARWLLRALAALAALVVLLLAPVGYTELVCRGGPPAQASAAPLITDPDWQRPETRTLMTYPEWHIVHAYEDYARVTATGDPHDFGYLRAIAGFWSALCPLKSRAMAMGEITGDTKATIYTIGVSFTAELLAKAAYEETLGRLATMLRGPQRSSLDDLTARRDADYAAFLTQTPWYQWDFGADARALAAASTGSLRDRERALALGAEYRAKALYARAIAAAVGGIGADALRLRSVVTGLSEADLRAVPGVQVIGPSGAGILIEIDRYRAFTDVALRIAAAGGDFAEIAGNDEILVTILSAETPLPDTILSFARQGANDRRHLVLLPVSSLAETIRGLGGAALEHIHDY